MAAGGDIDVRNRRSVDAVVFDLGGVLVEFSRTENMAAMAGLDTATFLPRWLACPWVRDFEAGRCSMDAFVRGVVDTWPLAVDYDTFLETFGAWPGGLVPGARELLRDLRRGVRVACMSNTNAYHCERQGRGWGLGAGSAEPQYEEPQYEESLYEEPQYEEPQYEESLYDETFLSFRTGLLKPDPEAYEHVLDVLGTAARRTLFLDDTDVNVAGARHVGLRAEVVRGIEEARGVLRRYGLVS